MSVGSQSAVLQPTASPDELSGRKVRRLPAFLGACVVSTVFFCVVAPTLHWHQFHDSIENLNVATALEIRRGGPWLIPTLQGIPRLAKPPITAWLTAAAIRSSTLAALDSDDAAVRADAYESLAREARLPALLAACALILAVYTLGHAVKDEWTGLTAACVCAGTLILFRQARVATIDIQLALWVTVANVFFARVLFRGHRWAGWFGAGIALGLALMTKGPVALLPTLLPFTVLAIFARLRRAHAGAAGRPLSLWVRWLPVACGISLMLAIGGWWYICVMVNHPGLGSYWWAEATSLREAQVAPGKWYTYLVSLPLFMPWLIWWFAGAGATAGSGGTEESWGNRRAATAGLLLLFLPLLVMSFAHDLYQRYMTPMLGGASLLAAAPLVALRRPAPPQQRKWRSLGICGHWLLLTAIAIATPIAVASAGTSSLTAADGSTLLTKPQAICIAAAGVLVVGGGIWWQRRWAGSLVVATLAVMMALQAIYFRAASQSANEQSTLRPIAEQIRSRFPQAQVYVYRPPGRYPTSVPGDDLSIHLNRTILWAHDPTDIAPAGKPQVYVVYRTRRAGDSLLPPPPGWQLLARLRGSEDRCVFVRP